MAYVGEFAEDVEDEAEKEALWLAEETPPEPPEEEPTEEELAKQQEEEQKLELSGSRFPSRAIFV